MADRRLFLVRDHTIFCGSGCDRGWPRNTLCYHTADPTVPTGCIWFGGCACAPTEEQARTFGVGHITTANDFPGRPERVVELGVDYFVIGSGRFPNLTTLVVVTDQVLPALNAVVRRL